MKLTVQSAIDRYWLGLTALAVTLAMSVVHAGVLAFELMGDDYQWVQHARAAVSRPGLLLADLDTFYRPANTWTLAIDWMIHGSNPAGYYLTNLILHGCCATLLAFAACRLGLGRVAASAVAVVWAVSPFTVEPAASVAIRFQSLLFAGWLIAICAWPRAGESWSRRRMIAVLAGFALTAASKETWVVSPALVGAVAWTHQRLSFRRAFVTALVSAVPVALYVIAYFVAFPSDKHYFDPSLHTLAKLPHALASFLHLERFAPRGFAFTWAGAVALGIVAAVGIIGLRRRIPAAAVGLFLLFASPLPTILVPFLPTRYTTLPYAGFLLLLVAVAIVLSGELSRSGRRVAVAVLGAFGALVLVAGGTSTRLDLDDWRRASEAHARLLTEARVVGAAFPLDRPVLVLRSERSSPLEEIAASERGFAKPWFIRGQDPYGLVHTSALFDWTLAARGVHVRNVARDAPIRPGVEAAVLVHFDGGFDWATPIRDLGPELATLEDRGIHVPLVRARPGR